MRKILSSVLFSTFAVFAADQAQAAAITGNATADDQFNAYISSSDAVLGTLIGSGNSWSSTYSVTGALSGSSLLYLHVIAVNSGGGPDGFLGTFTIDNGFTFANGSNTLSTDTANWRSIGAANSNWVVPVGTPISYGANGVSPWGFHSAIDPNAQWIWSTPDAVYADFSTTLTPAAPGSTTVPEPLTLSIFGAGLTGMGMMRRRRAKAQS